MARDRMVIGRLGTKRLLVAFVLLGLVPWTVVPWLYADWGALKTAPFVFAWGSLCILSFPYAVHLTAGRGVGLWIEGDRLHFPHGSAALSDISEIVPMGHTIFTDLPDYVALELRSGRRAWFSHAVFRTPYGEILSRLRAHGLVVRELPPPPLTNPPRRGTTETEGER